MYNGGRCIHRIRAGAALRHTVVSRSTWIYSTERSRRQEDAAEDARDASKSSSSVRRRPAASAPSSCLSPPARRRRFSAAATSSARAAAPHATPAAAPAAAGAANAASSRAPAPQPPASSPPPGQSGSPSHHSAPSMQAPSEKQGCEHVADALGQASGAGVPVVIPSSATPAPAARHTSIQAKCAWPASRAAHTTSNAPGRPPRPHHSSVNMCTVRPAEFPPGQTTRTSLCQKPN